MKDQKLSYVVRCITSYVVGGHPEYSVILHIHSIWRDWSKRNTKVHWRLRLGQKAYGFVCVV